MSMHTQTSTSGFIASDPQLSQTAKGDARFYARFGQEHYRRESDGSFTQLETTYHNMVMFGRSARHAHERFAKGDKFIAEGYVRQYDRSDDNGQPVKAEEFVAKKIGHDLARTRYTVDRPRRTPAADSLDAGLEDAALSPDTERRTSAGTAVVGR